MRSYTENVTSSFQIASTPSQATIYSSPYHSGKNREMTPFSFHTVPAIHCALGSTRQLGALIRAQFPHVTHALIVTDGGFLHTGLLDTPQKSLREHGIDVSVYSDVVADPPEEIVLSAATHARNLRVDLVIGFGGGSSMDVAKLLSVLAKSSQTLSAMYGIDNVQGPRLPLVQIPTTAGTGSEVTPISIVTTGETTKMGVVSPILYADLAILDAELTTGLPPHITAATGVDAMVHAIEAYTSRLKKNPLSDALARQALALLFNNIKAACANGNDLEARQAMLLGAMLAGQAFANAPVAAVHALAYPIGGIFHVPHGLSNSLVLPAVLRFNTPSADVLYAELAELIVPDATGDALARSHCMIEKLEDLARTLGIATRLRDVGITTADLDRLADAAMLQTRLLGNNPRTMTREAAFAIYQQSL